MSQKDEDDADCLKVPPPHRRLSPASWFPVVFLQLFDLSFLSLFTLPADG